MSEWISVKDKAPQIRNGGCIVCDAHGFVSETHSLCMVTERKKGQYYLSDQYTYCPHCGARMEATEWAY